MFLSNLRKCCVALSFLRVKGPRDWSLIAIVVGGGTICEGGKSDFTSTGAGGGGHVFRAVGRLLKMGDRYKCQILKGFFLH